MKNFSLNKIIIPGYFIALCCLCYFLWTTYSNLNSTYQNSHEFGSSLALQEATEAVFNDIRDMETGARGFVITGNDEFLKPYNSANARISANLTNLKKTFRFNIQPEVIRSLYFLISEKAVQSGEQVRLRRIDGMDSAVNMVLTGRGNEMMDSIRVIVSSIETGCYSRLAKSNTDKKLMAKNTVKLFFITGGFVIIILALSCLLLLRAFRRKNIYEKQVDYLSGIADQAHDAVIYTDINFSVTLWNEGAKKMFGYSLEETLGKSCAVVLKSNFHNENRLLITNEILMHGYWKGEVIFSGKNNGQVYTLMTASAVANHAGELAGFIFLISDITSLRSMEQKFSGALKSSRDVVIMLNEAGSIQAANPNSEELFGYTPKEINGMPAQKIFPGIRARIKKLLTTLQENNSNDYSVELKSKCRTKAGIVFAAHLSLCAFPTVKGSVVFISLRSPSDEVLSEFRSLLNEQKQTE